MNASPSVYIENLDKGYQHCIQEGFDWVDLKSKIKWGDTVFIKPNLTFPHFRQGVMTNPDCVESIVIALKDYTNNIIVGESDSGGYNRFSISEVFEKTGIDSFKEKYGVRVVNLSDFPYRSIKFNYKFREVELPLPTMLLDEVDFFITAPVPKIHMYTYMSSSVKNQWGCIPVPAMRLRLHPLLEKVVYEINKNIRTSLSVVDGKYGLNRSGPMRGDVVELDWLMVADNIYAADVTCCHLMQLNPLSVYYLRHLKYREHVLPDICDIRFNQDYQKFVKDQFYLQRTWYDSLSYAAFRSSFLTYWTHYSPLADFLHKLLYLFREPFYNYEDPSTTENKSDS